MCYVLFNIVWTLFIEGVEKFSNLSRAILALHIFVLLRHPGQVDAVVEDREYICKVEHYLVAVGTFGVALFLANSFSHFLQGQKDL